MRCGWEQEAPPACAARACWGQLRRTLLLIHVHQWTSHPGRETAPSPVLPAGTTQSLTPHVTENTRGVDELPERALRTLYLAARPQDRLSPSVPEETCRNEGPFPSPCGASSAVWRRKGLASRVRSAVQSAPDLGVAVPRARAACNLSDHHRLNPHDPALILHVTQLAPLSRLRLA